MRLVCGHWTDTSSLCHSVCQQQALHDDEHADDDDGHGYVGDHGDDNISVDGDYDDAMEEEDGDVIFFSPLMLHPIPS